MEAIDLYSNLLQTSARIASDEMKDEKGRKVGGETKFGCAMQEAHATVDADPATWRRGKDRAARFLEEVLVGLGEPPRLRGRQAAAVSRLRQRRSRR